MKLLKLCICVAFSLLLAPNSYAQLDSYRPKIAEFSYHILDDYRTVSSSELFGDASSETDQERLLKLKLGIPLVIRDKALFGLQFKYNQHYFGFDDDDFPQDYDLYNHLSGQAFTNLGVRFLYQKSLDENRELTFAGGTEIKSDEINFTRNTTKYFITGQYKKKLNETTKIGFGGLFSQGLRLTSFYPLFLFEKSLSPGWTLDLNLPKSVSLRHEVNPKTYIMAQAEIEGWRYNLTSPIQGNDKDFTLRKADIELRLRYERAIHDWLWLGIDLGYNKNVNYYLANPGDRGANALIDLSARDTKYLRFSIFIVPPKGFSR